MFPASNWEALGTVPVRFLESAGQLIATIYQSHLVNLVNDVLLALHLDADFSRVVGEEEEEEAIRSSERAGTPVLSLAATIRQCPNPTLT